MPLFRISESIVTQAFFYYSPILTSFQLLPILPLTLQYFFTNIRILQIIFPILIHSFFPYRLSMLPNLGLTDFNLRLNIVSLHCTSKYHLHLLILYISISFCMLHQYLIGTLSYSSLYIKYEPNNPIIPAFSESAQDPKCGIFCKP